MTTPENKVPKGAESFKRKKSNVEKITPVPETKQVGDISREQKDVSLSKFQLEYQKTQIGRLEKAEGLFEAIPDAHKEHFLSLKNTGKTALDAQRESTELPIESQIAIAKTYSADALIEGAFEKYALDIDGLTGLNKEQALIDFLEEKRSKGVAVAGIHFDIDKFKDFNDNYGHAAGDEVLQVAAQIVMEVRGESGFAARNHDRGEEFSLLFSEDEMTQEEKDEFGNVEALAIQRSEELRALIQKESFRFKNIKTEDGSLEDKIVTASIGVAERHDMETDQEFRNRMEHASAYAKNVMGRNAVESYSEDVENWRLSEIAQRSSDSQDALAAATGTPAYSVEKIDPITEQKIEAIEAISGGSIRDEYSSNHLEINIQLEEALLNGTLPEIDAFEKTLNSLDLTDSEKKDLWFYHAALAETNTEIFGDQARRDSLTKLYNRQEIGRQLKEALAEAKDKGEVVSVALMDMDFFKSVNDTYGHAVGDEILKHVGAFLQEKVSQFSSDTIVGKGRTDIAPRSTRLNGVVGRFGGEEFVIIASMSQEDLKELIDREIISVLEAREFKVEMDGEEYSLRQTLTFGITQNQGPDGFIEESEMLENADKALYGGKLRGRSQSNTYSENFNNESIRLEKERQEREGTDELIR